MYRFFVAILLVAVIGLGAAGAQYAVYYAATANQDTALVLMNAGGKATYYTIKVYDAYGTLLDTASGDLDAFESDYQVISDIVDTDKTHWGLALVESPGLLAIGLETFVNNSWQASDNVTDPVTAGDATYYWYGLNYSDTSDQATGVAVVNPHAKPVAGKVFIYDATGALAHSEDFLLDPHEADYFSVGKLIPPDDSMWGMVDIKATAPIVVAGEYFTADGALMNVDELTRPYYTE